MKKFYKLDKLKALVHLLKKIWVSDEKRTGS